MSTVLFWLLRGKQSPGNFLILLVLGLIFTGWGVGNGYSGDEIQIVVRFFYFLQVSIFAFMTSWVLFPQTDMWLTQVLNPTQKSIMILLFGRTSSITFGSILFLSAVIVGGSNVTFTDGIIIWIDTLFFSLGITVFSTGRFLSIGSSSQRWQEGRKGKAFVDYMNEAGSGGAGVPPGAIPTILATSLVAIVGMMCVVFQAWIQGVTGIHFPGIAGIVLLIPGLYTWGKKASVLDSEFYHSHGFYNELFRNPGGRADGGREPVPIKSLYWVPDTIKPATWLTFRQMDRKFPLGRLLVLLFLVYWGLIKASVLDVQSIVLIPFLIIIGKNLILLTIERPPYSSLWYRRTLGSDWHWIGVHIATGIRWTIPILFFLMLTVWFVDGLSQNDLIFWLIFDVSSILSIAIGRTVSTSLTYAKNYR